MKELYGTCVSVGKALIDDEVVDTLVLKDNETQMPTLVILDWAKLKEQYCQEPEPDDHIYVSAQEKNGRLVATYMEQWGRICCHCGKHHEEGYWIDEYQYACSEACAISLMGGKENFDKAMDEYDDDADYNPICWVEWYN